MRTRTITATAFLLLAVSGCGVGGGGDDQKAEEAIADKLMSSTDGAFSFEQEQADCIGKGMVDEIGVDQMQEIGLLNEDLEAEDSPDGVEMNKEDAEVTADVFMECVDIGDLLQEQMELGDLPAETADCIDEALSDDVVREFLAAAFQGEDEEGSATALLEPLQECIIPS